MIFEHGDYRSFLRELVERRIQENPAYSMRAFARQMGIAPSLLSEVFSGKHNLSAARALRVAPLLKLRSKPEERKQS